MSHTFTFCKTALQFERAELEAEQRKMNESSHCNLHDDGMMDMKMARKRYFHFDVCQRLIFESWENVNTGDLLGTVCAIYILAILYEGLKTLRNFLLYCDESRKQVDANNEDEEIIATINDTEQLIKNDEQLIKTDNQHKTTRQGRMLTLTLHGLQSLLHVLQIGYAYVLMFAAMTFNGWLFFAVCFGSGTGYLLFTKIKWFKIIKRK